MAVTCFGVYKPLVIVTAVEKSLRTPSSVMIWNLVITFSGLFQNGVTYSYVGQIMKDLQLYELQFTCILLYLVAMLAYVYGLCSYNITEK